MSRAMTHLSNLGIFSFICLLGGAVHILAPDHWVPVSILSWQHGWRLSRLTAFVFLAFLFHVLLGFLIYWLLQSLIFRVPASAFWIYTVFLIGSVAMVRGIRFKKIRDILRSGSGGFWGIMTVFSFLGPCESIIPILLKARHLGTGYMVPVLAFLLGTVVAGMVLITGGQRAWNRPLWLPRGVQWFGNGAMTFPVMAGVMLSLALLLKLP